MSSRISRKYAKALFEQVQSEKSLDAQYSIAVQEIEQIFSQPKIKALFKSPIILNETKQQLVSEIVKQLKAPTSLARFASGVANAGRSGFLSDIMTEFRSLWDRSQGILDVYVSSATELTVEQEKSLTEMIEQSSKAKVQLTKNINPELIGGVVLTVGNSRLDLSIRKKISDFAKLASN